MTPSPRARLRAYFLAAIVTVFYFVYSRLWRVVEVNAPAPEKIEKGVVYAHWHGDELALIGPFAFRSLAVLVSRSQDGEMLNLVLRWLGFTVVRGSSSRGGAGGLKGLIDAMKRPGQSSSLAVDGPRGPIFVVKPGAIKLASESGALLIPGAVAVSRRFVFKRAWNKCFLPLPFARCVVIYGEPIAVPPGLDAEAIERERGKLEGVLKNLKHQADAYFQKSLGVAECSS